MNTISRMLSIRSLRPNVIAHRASVVVVKHVGFRFSSASVMVQKLAVPRLQQSVSLPTAFGVINRHFSLTSDESSSDIPVFDIDSKLFMKNGQPYTGWSQVNFPIGTYSGDFVDGKRHGSGVFKNKNGEKYEGEWKDNNKDGVGFITDADGNILSQGLFKDGKLFTGTGRTKTNHGSMYEGELLEGQRHGQGKLTTKAGRVWEGEFRHGEPFNGKGWFYKEKGVWVEGVFTADLIDPVVVTSSANVSFSSKIKVVKKEHRRRKKVPEEESYHNS